MRSILWKSGIIAAFILILHCVNEPLLPLHPVLKLTLEKRQVTLSTSVAKQLSMYKIVDNACTLSVNYRLNINGVDSILTNHFEIKNDSLQSGTFYGNGMVPDSVLPDSILSRYRTLISGCVLDETKHEACASLVLNGTLSQPATRH
ncbi:MAG: hypothetical protein JW795_18060 [Chitinivibrionales bacterium]|nr:hypothetical protein [Chitinivibrionales bacterium]